MKCSVGKKGTGIKKKEGDLITPKGCYELVNIFYRSDRISELSSKFKLISIKKNMGWCDDPRSRQYNKLIKLPFGYRFEKLYRRDYIYDIILVLNYNMFPAKKNKGSAIFIHVSNKNYKPTKGCIAIKKNELIRLVSLIKKKDKNKNFLRSVTKYRTTYSHKC